MQPDGTLVGVVGVGCWDNRHMRVLRYTTGVAAVVGVDQRFAQFVQDLVRTTTLGSSSLPGGHDLEPGE